MSKIYKTSDRIRIQVDGLVFIISPLTFDQKAEIQALAASGDLVKGLQAAKLAVKYAVKGVEGLTLQDGTEYSLGLVNGVLSEEDIDVLFNIENSDKLAFTCLNLIQSVPKDFINPHTGQKLSGVSFVKESSEKKS